jgi:hypothetical protein
MGAVDSSAVERWDVTPLYVSWISWTLDRIRDEDINSRHHP